MTVRSRFRRAGYLTALVLLLVPPAFPAAAQDAAPATAPASAPTTAADSARRAAVVITPAGISVDLRAAWEAAANKLCVVCGVRQGRIEHSELHKGALVPVCEQCVAKYRMNPEPYFAKLQPRAALFQDNYEQQAPVSRAAFWLGAYALLGVICAGVAGHTAVRRGHPAWPYVLAGFVGTVLGVAAALLLDRKPMPHEAAGLRKIPRTSPPAPCPKCGHGNHPAARACARCAAPLDPVAVAEAETVLHG